MKRPRIVKKKEELTTDEFIGRIEEMTSGTLENISAIKTNMETLTGLPYRDYHLDVYKIALKVFRENIKAWEKV